MNLASAASHAAAQQHVTGIASVIFGILLLFILLCSTSFRNFIRMSFLRLPGFIGIVIVIIGIGAYLA